MKGNILTYVLWRGDLDFAERDFRDVDNLVLSYLAYYDFADIVSSGADGILLKEAVERYFEHRGKDDTQESRLLQTMAQSRRYRGTVLSHYVSQLDTQKQIQFAAIQIELGDGTVYLAFRGTDDSIVGWREDFSISYEVTPAQQKAVNYLKETMTQEQQIYRIGGHSKGGNLAFYASMKVPLELQERILRIYNNDGPGICPERMDMSAYEQIRGKLTRIVPAYSIIGRLFEPNVGAIIVSSNANGLAQHDLLSWQVEGDRLYMVPQPEEESLFYNRIFSQWIESANMQERESFTRDFFDALQGNGAERVTQISEGGLDGFGTILLSIVESESRTKIVIGKFVRSFLEQLYQCDFKKMLRSKRGIQGVLFILAGVVCILAPQFAIQSLGMVVAVVFFLWSAKRIVDCGLQYDMPAQMKRKKLIVDIAFVSLAVFLFTHYDFLLVSGNLLLGALFMGYALRCIRKVWHSDVGRVKRVITVICGIVVFMLGFVSFVTPEASAWPKMLSMGSVLVIYGLGLMLVELTYKPMKIK